MLIAALFTIARAWKQPRCPSADEWLRKLWYIYTMEYYSAITKNAFESVLCIRWPKYWSFSFNISPSNDYSGLISFRIDWLDLFVVQGSLKSLLQHRSSNALLVVREMQIKTMRRYHLTLVRMAIIKKSTNNK